MEPLPGRQATLRSDFYPRCAELQLLATLKRGSGQYDLQAPTPAEIGQMIRHPTYAAGLRFAEDPESRESLDETLLGAAASNPAALPLLEFVLEELYEWRELLGEVEYRESCPGDGHPHLDRD